MDINNLLKKNVTTNKNIDEHIYFETIYKHIKDDQNKTKIFDIRFINRNKDKCKIIYQNKEYELKEYYEDIVIDNNHEKKQISFILRINKNIIDISYMFYECEDLLLIRDKRNINYSNNDSLIINDMQDEINYSNENEENDEIFNQNKQNNLYKDCEDEQISSTISTITNKNTSNNFSSFITNDKDKILIPTECNNFNSISNMIFIFYECKSLISLPDISKWNITNITNMSCMFFQCKSLISLPDISEWNTANVTNTSDMFSECKSLISLPDLSKWNISNVTNMRACFINVIH